MALKACAAAAELASFCPDAECPVGVTCPSKLQGRSKRLPTTQSSRCDLTSAKHRVGTTPARVLLATLLLVQEGQKLHGTRGGRQRGHTVVGTGCPGRRKWRQERLQAGMLWAPELEQHKAEGVINNPDRAGWTPMRLCSPQAGQQTISLPHSGGQHTAEQSGVTCSNLQELLEGKILPEPHSWLVPGCIPASGHAWLLLFTSKGLTNQHQARTIEHSCLLGSSRGTYGPSSPSQAAWPEPKPQQRLLGRVGCCRRLAQAPAL